MEGTDDVSGAAGEDGDFHMDTWQALQKQNCMSLLVEVRALLAPAPAVAPHRLHDRNQLNHDHSSHHHHHQQRSHHEAAQHTPGAFGPSSFGCNNTADARSWQQYSRTALREVRDMLVNTSENANAFGMSVDLI